MKCSTVEAQYHANMTYLSITPGLGAHSFILPRLVCHWKSATNCLRWIFAASEESLFTKHWRL